MIWAVDWMETRQPTLEVNLCKGGLPQHSDIHYLRPGASENPLMASATDSNGDEFTVDGPWCLVLTAVSWKDMGIVLKCLFTEFMGI